jgi:hypothetical protein
MAKTPLARWVAALSSFIAAATLMGPAMATDAAGAASTQVRTVQLDAGPARAFSGVSVTVPLRALAAAHGLRLTSEIGDRPLPGPLTLLLEEDLAADVARLAAALGPTGPFFTVTIYRASHEMVVVQANDKTALHVVAARAVPKRSLMARMFGGKAAPTP